ncbi:serine ammonia-lyase [Paenibacillus beijingensis]|uniref:Probable D-serine dehydratase n=2 Tax=Paenibacillus beijingensis TaxID=1126833 RepID=A0A0D5NQH6_9BACL|nr:D-serine ammonia-lyase [Paenibacillus beijingensis]AJY77574.1 serine ammonia-lyase [Paenibacillus beijingensis]
MRTLTEQFPLVSELIAAKELFWANPGYEPFERGSANVSLSQEDVTEAEDRLRRFAPYLAQVFPELKENGGIIESPLVEIASMKAYMERQYLERQYMEQQSMDQHFDPKLAGRLLLKCDSHLPVSGSIKARGGIYEVLKHAEELAIRHGLQTRGESAPSQLPARGAASHDGGQSHDDYSALEGGQPHADYTALDSEKFRDFFSQYSVAVGSTGNLGLSIGIMSARIGFKATVHMSADAKQWKKDLLRSKGVTVVEYVSDYSKAVEEGRKQAAQDPKCYFIDDENSVDLFLGYATAASRLSKQLEEMNIRVDAEHPLFVYLPCGVGGGPGGVAFGLKLLFQDHVHCFFAEPTHSPCMLLGMMTGLHDGISVQDIGMDNVTAADGLAVGRPSGFVGRMMEPLLSGCYTVDDSTLYRLLQAMAATENIRLEPSALAGALGPVQLLSTASGQEYIRRHQLQDRMSRAAHIVWATGGSMVPKEIMEEYLSKK